MDGTASYNEARPAARAPGRWWLAATVDGGGEAGAASRAGPGWECSVDGQLLLRELELAIPAGHSTRA
jgi:hypothetical protein